MCSRLGWRTGTPLLKMKDNLVAQEKLLQKYQGLLTFYDPDERMQVGFATTKNKLVWDAKRRPAGFSIKGWTADTPADELGGNLGSC